MRCLFAVSSWFGQRASLTVNIDLSDVTNRYYTVLYRTVVVYEQKNRSLVFSGSRKKPNPWVHRSSGKLGKPRFPLERWAFGLGFFCPHWTPMMDSIYLTYLYQPVGTIKKRAAARWPHIDPWRHCNVKITSLCKISAYSGFLEAFILFSNIKLGI